MASYRDLARTRPHLRMLLEYLPCRFCATRLGDDARQLCAYDFAADAWFCSEEHREGRPREQESGRGVYSTATMAEKGSGR